MELAGGAAAIGCRADAGGAPAPGADGRLQRRASTTPMCGTPVGMRDHDPLHRRGALPPARPRRHGPASTATACSRSHPKATRGGTTGTLDFGATAACASTTSWSARHSKTVRGPRCAHRHHRPRNTSAPSDHAPVRGGRPELQATAPESCGVIGVAANAQLVGSLNAAAFGVGQGSREDQPATRSGVVSASHTSVPPGAQQGRPPRAPGRCSQPAAHGRRRAASVAHGRMRSGRQCGRLVAASPQGSAHRRGEWPCTPSGAGACGPAGAEAAAGGTRQPGRKSAASGGAAAAQCTSGGRSLASIRPAPAPSRSASGEMFSSWRTLPGKLKALPTPRPVRRTRNALGLHAELLGALSAGSAASAWECTPLPLARRGAGARRITLRRWNRSSRKAPSLDALLQVLVRGSDHAHIGLDRAVAARAGGGVRPSLTAPATGAVCSSNGMSPILVQKQACRHRPAQSGRAAWSGRSGERTALVAEQLALQQVLWGWPRC